MGIYIKSSEAISCQDSFNQEKLFDGELNEYGSGFQPALLPDFKQYVDAKLLRRMSKVLRMGVATAKLCLDKAQIQQPDAIIVGTGLGCLDDTAKFLNVLIENNESMLNPTPFIQSTHNTIAGQIALLLKCKGYNLTFTQKSLSFETALLDAFTLMNSGEANSVLLGGADEFNDDLMELVEVSGCFSAEDSSFFSEGASFFTLTNEKEEGLVQIVDMQLIHQLKEKIELEQKLGEFLHRNHLSMEDIDLLVSGADNNKYNHYYQEVAILLTNSTEVNYKKWVGTHPTVSSFALHLGHTVLKNNYLPSSLTSVEELKKDYKYALIFNHTNNEDFSFVLLTKD